MRRKVKRNCVDYYHESEHRCVLGVVVAVVAAVQPKRTLPL